MNNQEILDNAPKNWTHHATSSSKYFMIEGWRMHVWLGEVWSVPISNELDVLMVGDVRSLADIKRIAELEQENQVFKQQWHELNDSIEHQLKKGDAILKLEQQAKGVDWVIACRELNLSQGEVHTLMDKCNKLREQAKQLKEQSNV